MENTNLYKALYIANAISGPVFVMLRDPLPSLGLTELYRKLGQSVNILETFMAQAMDV